MRFLLWMRIGARNIMRNKRRSLIMLLAISAGMIGVVFFIGYINGWLGQWRLNIIHSGLGQFQIRADGAFTQTGKVMGFDLNQVSGVLQEDVPEAKWAPRVRGRGLLVGPEKSWPVVVVGIDPDREKEISSWPQCDIEGRYMTARDQGKIMISRKMADRFNTRLKKKLVLYSQGTGDELGSGAFRIAGIYRSDSPELDDTTIFVTLADAQSIFSIPGQVSEVTGLGIEDELLDTKVAEMKPLLASRDLEIKTWLEQSPLMAQMLDMVDWMMWIFYLIIFIAMSFGIINVLLIAVLERTREFGVLRAIGTPPGGLVWTILWEALALGVVGCIIGDIIGLLIVHYFHVNGLDLSLWAEGMEYFGISSIMYFEINWIDMLTVNLALLVMILLAGLYPALKARRGNPAELLRR